jgi:hypothetical protein
MKAALVSMFSVLALVLMVGCAGSSSGPSAPAAATLSKVGSNYTITYLAEQGAAGSRPVASLAGVTDADGNTQPSTMEILSQSWSDDGKVITVSVGRKASAAALTSCADVKNSTLSAGEGSFQIADGEACQSSND